jgi:hypothetical protein
MSVGVCASVTPLVGRGCVLHHQDFVLYRTCTHVSCIFPAVTRFSPHDPSGRVLEAMLWDTSDIPDAFGALAFTDESNRAWEVREIREPILPARHELLVRGEYGAGWLLFSSGDERRRLAPYPRGWRLAGVAQLRCWVHDARPAPRRVRAGSADDERGVSSLPRSAQDTA